MGIAEVPSTAPDPSSSADQPNGAKLLALLSSQFLLPKKPHQVLLERPLEQPWQRAHSAASANPLKPYFTGSLFKPPYSMYDAAPNNLTPPPAVELAYAAFRKRPIIFQSSIRFLRMKCCLEAGEVRIGLKRALAGYPLISTETNTIDDLEDALVKCLANAQGVCADTPEEAAQKTFSLFDRVSLNANTNFLGLPKGPAKDWKKKDFDDGVATLSALRS